MRNDYGGGTLKEYVRFKLDKFAWQESEFFHIQIMAFVKYLVWQTKTEIVFK